MADRTKDIWNDSPEEEQKKPKGQGLKRFLTFLLILIAVLAVVLVAAYRDGTGVDVLQRLFNYGKSDAVNGETVYEYDISPQNRFAMLGSNLVIASDTGARMLDQQGAEVWARTINLPNPALMQGGDRAVVYGVGGTNLFVIGEEGELLHLTADEEEPFVAATLNENGWLAVTTEKKNYKGSVSVYDKDLELVFRFDSANRFVEDAYVLEDNKSLAVVTLGQEEGVFVSNILIYSLDASAAKREETSGDGELVVTPYADYDVRNGLILTMDQQEKQIVTVSDTCLTFANLDGEILTEVSYGNDFLRGYALGGTGFTALLLNRYQSGSVGQLRTFAADGTEIAALDVNQEVLDLSAAGKYLAVLYADSLVIYNQELQVYASLQGTDFATGVLVRTDGSALLMSADSAGLFLP